MEEPSLEVVLKALDALFRKDDTQEKEQASLWLTQLQGSVCYPQPFVVLINAHLFHALSIPLLVVGARMEGSRPVVTASERYGDELLCSTDYAE